MDGFEHLSANNVENLVSASITGDRRAFDELVLLYQQPAMRLAVRILASSDEAADAVQDAFVKAFLSINTIKNPGRFGAWFFSIVSNVAVSRLRSIKRRHRVHQANIALIQKSNEHCDPLSVKELAQAMQQAMMKLSDKQIKAISLFGLKDLSQNEVAEIMNCSTESVRWYVFQARKNLKELLKDYL